MSRTLREYARESKRSLYEIAKSAGIDDSVIYAIADGRRGCRPETAAKIRIATEGEVTEFDLLRVRLEWIDAQKANVSGRKRAGKKTGSR